MARYIALFLPGHSFWHQTDEHSHIRSQKDLLSEMAGEGRLSLHIQRLGHKLVRYPNPVYEVTFKSVGNSDKAQACSPGLWWSFQKVPRRDGDLEKWKWSTQVSQLISQFLLAPPTNLYLTHVSFGFAQKLPSWKLWRSQIALLHQHRWHEIRNWHSQSWKSLSKG